MRHSAQRTRKSNKDFACTTLDVWDRLRIAIEYSLSDNAVLDTIIENLVAAIHDNSGGISQKMLDAFVLPQHAQGTLQLLLGHPGDIGGSEGREVHRYGPDACKLSSQNSTCRRKTS